ncbi:MAG: hypothetical protein ABUL44_00575, partial [Flavobacterium sp.]
MKQFYSYIILTGLLLVFHNTFSQENSLRNIPVNSNGATEYVNITPGGILNFNRLLAAPANDNCTSATALTIDGGCTTGTTASSTIQSGELWNTCFATNYTCCGGGVTYQSVWYSFYTGSNTTLNLAFIQTNTTNCYSGIAVWGPYNSASGNCFPSGSPAHCLELQTGDPGYHPQLTGLTQNK